MVRPKQKRCINFLPNTTYFKPKGIQLNKLETIEISLEEIEAIRLKDYKKLSQEEAATQMNISQPTFHRIISSARNKIAIAIINAKAIQINTTK